MKRYTKKQYLELLDKLEGQVKRDLLDAIRECMRRVNITQLRAAIISGDMDRVVAVAGLSRGDLSVVTETLRRGYLEAAAGQAIALDLMFDITLPTIQTSLSVRSAEFVVNLTGEAQRQAIRDTVAAGYADGRNPNSVAIDLVGRIGRTGYREGGVVGLTHNQSRYIINMRRELYALDSNYFTRQRRDRRFDETIKKAIRTRTPLTDAQIQRITGRYADRLKALRGEAIARTEALRTINQGRYDALVQAVDQTGARLEDVTLTWSATMDRRTRDLHEHLNRKSTTLGGFFQDDNGNIMRYPGDWELDADPETLINCRCFLETKVNFAALSRAA